MSNFDLVLVNDAVNAFCDAENGPAEAIEYWPSGAGSGREINALVDRDPPARIGENKQNIVSRTTIEVVNSATYGILATELDKGTDRVKIAMRKGGSLEFRSIARILSQDGGMITLEIH